MPDTTLYWFLIGYECQLTITFVTDTKTKQSAIAHRQQDLQILTIRAHHLFGFAFPILSQPPTVAGGLIYILSEPPAVAGALIYIFLVQQL
jgi:hypothetical protein